MKSSASARRFRHLENVAGRAPSALEARVYEGVAAELARGDGPLPRVVYVPDVAAVFPRETRDEAGQPCIGLVVELLPGVEGAPT